MKEIEHRLRASLKLTGERSESALSDFVIGFLFKFVKGEKR